MEHTEHIDHQTDNELDELKIIEQTRDESLALKESVEYNGIKKIVDDLRLLQRQFNTYKLEGHEFIPTNFDKNKQDEIKNNFIKYVLQGKLGSGEDSTMENIYNILAEHPLQGWKLKHIKDNKGRDTASVLAEIEKKNLRTKPVDANEIKSFPDDIKNLLGKGYNFFLKGKSLIAKTSDGTAQYLGECIRGVYRFFKPLSEIRSKPFDRNPKTGFTRCSRTARLNAEMFGVKIPDGNAAYAVSKPIEDTEHFISTVTKEGNNNSYIDINTVAPGDSNFADMSLTSTTSAGKKFGHRAVAFRNDDGQWYALDPYYSGGYGTKPIPWDKYPKHNLAKQINFYNATTQTRTAV